MTEASFDVDVTPASAQEFARLSGDWNPLHTDPAHAAGTPYRRPILHGAFSAGLVSRMAGMHLPGVDCLLHGIDLKFIAPIIPPATLRVTGKLVGERHGLGRVEVTIADVATGTRYVAASYEFGRHAHGTRPAAPASATPAGGEAPVVLVTGATGGLGRAVVARLGARALAVSRAGGDGIVAVPDLGRAESALGGRRLAAVIHCAWPAPDNQRLVALPDPARAVDHHVAGPLRDAIHLAQLLARHGEPNAPLVLIGSTAAAPGRHNYRMPLYTIAKATIPELVRVLALELAATGHRAIGVVFDVIEAGMNQRLSASARIAHADRSPMGKLPSADEAAAQLAWILDGPGWLASGATISLTGGALP